MVSTDQTVFCVIEILLLNLGLKFTEGLFLKRIELQKLAEFLGFI
jgi:hypothetical protein